MTKYEQYLERARAQHGDRFSAGSLNPAFVEYYNTQVRVRVRFSHGEELTGRIGVTTGWGPCFLLMRTSRAIGSPYTIGSGDRVVAIFGGRRGYVPIVDVPEVTR